MSDGRQAFYAAIKASPDDWGLYLIFSDWLRDHGEEALADGFAAMGRLRVRAGGRYTSLNPVNCISLPAQILSGRPDRTDWAAVLRVRRLGHSEFVSAPWFDATHTVFRREKSHTGGLWTTFQQGNDAVARGYAALTPAQKADAERLAVHLEVAG